MVAPILLATLGSEPQVVTIALQLLVRQGVPIESVVVLHTSAREPAIGAALAQLRGAFAAPPLASYPLTLEPLICRGLPLQDITSEEEAEATFRSIFHAVRRLKRAGAHIHFAISGGRKVMAVYGLAVAQLLFDDRDALYYLVSAGDLLRERRLTVRAGDRVQLVAVPFLRWTADTALIADLMRFDDPLEAVRRGTELVRQSHAQRSATFCQHVLTPAEEAVVALVVREGLGNEEIGRRLGRSPKTVANQLSSAYARLAEYMAWDEARAVDRYTVITLLHSYYAGR